MNYLLLTGCLLLAAPLTYGADTLAGPASASPAAAPEQTSFSGKVLETLNAAGYTYVLVDTGRKQLWAAAPRFAVKKGDSAAVANGMAMVNYHSKTLNRDFEVVYFTPSVTVNGVRPASAGSMGELPKNHPPIGGAYAQSKIDLSGIKPAAGGRTVAQIYADKARLSGQEVKVRGKVVKFNPMIMGRNWVHIRDGSGSEGSNDLLLTTVADVKVGDMVLVTGTVITNKDFGANYKYAVMLENAKVKVE
jgi:hypothetical protein